MQTGASAVGPPTRRRRCARRLRAFPRTAEQPSGESVRSDFETSQGDVRPDVWPCAAVAFVEDADLGVAGHFTRRGWTMPRPSRLRRTGIPGLELSRSGPRVAPSGSALRRLDERCAAADATASAGPWLRR